MYSLFYLGHNPSIVTSRSFSLLSWFIFRSSWETWEHLWWPRIFLQQWSPWLSLSSLRRISSTLSRWCPNWSGPMIMRLNQSYWKVPDQELEIDAYWQFRQLQPLGWPWFSQSLLHSTAAFRFCQLASFCSSCCHICCCHHFSTLYSWWESRILSSWSLHICSLEDSFLPVPLLHLLTKSRYCYVKQGPVLSLGEKVVFDQG